MKDLGITKQTHLLHGDCFKNEYDFYTQPVSSTKSGTILFANAYGKTEKEAKYNAKLISDAGTTANKCGLLPSKLLEQRDEMLVLFGNIVEYWNGDRNDKAMFDALNHIIYESEQLIKKATE